MSAASVAEHVANSNRPARIWLTACVAVLVLAPMAAPVILALAAAPLLAARLPGMDAFARRPTAVSGVLLVAAAYLFVNASWSLSPSAAYASAAMFAGVVGVVTLANLVLPESDDQLLRAMSIGLCAALLAGGAFVCLEVFTAQAVMRTLTTFVPALRPDGRHMVLENGWVTSRVPHLLNRSLTIITLLFWPALLLISVGLGLSGRSRVWLLLAFVPLAAAILGSSHGTSMIALAGGALTFSLFAAAPGLTRRLVIVGWAAATLLVVPAASLAYSSGLYQSKWLVKTAQHRVVIWGYTSEQIAKAPWLGIGLGSTRALFHDKTQVREVAPGSDFERTAHWHTHNGYLQTWYEAGAVGALLLFAIGLAVLRSISRLAPAAQPYMHAAFVSSALMAASSFSLWQAWFLASFGITAVLCAVAIHCTGHRVAAERDASVTNAATSG